MSSAARASYNVSITHPGGITGNFIFDAYNDDRFLLDLKSVYNFSRAYSLYFDIYNLTNEWSFERVFDQFGREHKFSAQGNGVVFHVGFKARF